MHDAGIQKYLRHMKIITQLKLDNNLRCNYTKFQLQIVIIFRLAVNFPRVFSFCLFYNRSDRERNGAFSEMCALFCQLFY